MINGFINGQDLRLSQPKIAADTIDYLEVVFKFQTADWDDLEKWAHFQKGDVVYDVMLENDKISKNKHLNLTAGYWYVYLHGNAFEDGQMVQRITTDIAKLAVEQSGVLDGDPLPLVPPSVAAQLSARIANLERGGGSVGGGLDGLSIYTGTASFGGTTMILPSSVNVPYGRTLQAGDLIVDTAGVVFSVTSADDTLVYIENTGVNLKGADGYGIFPCGTNAPTINGATATVLINFFHLPFGYTLRVGDTAVGSNGYLAKVTAISGSNVTLTGTGISIKGADGSGGGVESLIGTTENIAPSDVYTALTEGRQVVLAHTEEGLGEVMFNSFAVLDDSMVGAHATITMEGVAANITLLGTVTEGTWGFSFTQLPSTEVLQPYLTPTVTAEDNGKILQVVDGAWAAVAITNGNEVAY